MHQQVIELVEFDAKIETRLLGVDLKIGVVKFLRKPTKEQGHCQICLCVPVIGGRIDEVRHTF